MEVTVKVACRSMTATDYSHRATSMLLIFLVEVSVKVACQSTTGTYCSHRATSMLLILVEESVNVACQSTTATELPPCYLFWWKYLKLARRSTTATDCSHKTITLLLILVEV